MIYIRSCTPFVLRKFFSLYSYSIEALIYTCKHIDNLIMRTLLALVIVASLLVPFARAHQPTRQFERFFPGWDSYIQDILKDQCKKDYETYLTGEIAPGAPRSSLAFPLMDCILKKFPEYRKAEIASSTVILGLLPTMLQSLGTSVAEKALIGCRRPLLGILLAAGTPAVSPARDGEFTETLAKFVFKKGNKKPEGYEPILITGLSLSGSISSWKWVISIAEYALLLPAVANVLYTVYRLGDNAVVAFAPATTWLLPLWASLAVAIHLLGLVVLILRVDVRLDKYGRSKLATSLLDWVEHPIVPCAFQPPRRLTWKKDTVWFTGLAWFMNTAVLAHIIFGTLVMSSLLFFSVTDSVTIMARFAVSAVVCRIIARFELAGIAHQIDVAEPEDDGCELTGCDRNGSNEDVESEGYQL
ncbi:hypothetical protein B0T10DRAFT_473980 [Thelonectria olida]|uniref:Uncharacterized protein n=1 Tax=Thelonectria olida TaxID=1576542 RepID=A0A9P9AVI5_9HYPO|nr:hypothetical protein B0T10DRAFT_473980 [Thelonectria olida]